VPGDNPSQSETSGHIGGKGNHPCRKCDVGGPYKIRETDEGFHASFSVRESLFSLTLPNSHSALIQQAGELRLSQNTLLKVEAQVQAACLGVAQAVKDLQTETGVKDAFTQSTIDELITSARNMQKLQPHKTAAEIQGELMLWVNANKARVYNPFLTMKGMFCP
jgi:hypothetical protein